MTLPDLIGYSSHSTIFIDTETTGLGRYDVPVGLSYALENGQSGYLAWGHKMGGNNVDRDAVVRWWNDEIVSRNVRVVCHNAVFDMRMLNEIGCRIPAVVEDTCVIAALLDEFEPTYSLDGLSKKHLGENFVKDTYDADQWCLSAFGPAGSSRNKGSQVANYWQAPGNIIAPYAMQDAVLTRMLWLNMRPQIEFQDLSRVHELESALIPILVKMYRAGVRVDLDRATALKSVLTQENQDAHVQLEHLNGGPVNVESSVEVANMLTKFGVVVPLTAVGNPSVRKEWLATVNHPAAELIVKARRTRHYANVFIDSYIFDNVTEFSVIHPSFHQAKSSFGGTITGRFSSAGGLNAQNIPKRDSEWAPKIRGLFVPAYDGGQWLRIDFSQIEYRFFAHYAGGEVQRRYADDPSADFHQMVADMCDIPRGPAKSVNFGFLFGMGEKKLAKQLNLPMEEAREIFAKYHRVIPEARSLSQRAANRAASRGYIVTWGGRKCHFQRFGNKYGETHKALNKLCQGSAADLIKHAMIAVDEVINWEDQIMHLTVHDELDLTVPGGDEGMIAAKRIKEAMESAGALRVPVMAEAELGPDWGDTPTSVR